MSTNQVLTWAVIAIIVVGGGWYILTQNKASTDSAAGPQTGTVSQNNTGGTDAMNNPPASDPAMNGTWKSNDDAKFTRTFKADGTVTDAYQGDASATESGTYAVVDPLKESAGAFGSVSAASLTGMTVLKLTFPKSGVMYFGVNSMTETSLKLTYIGRGNVLTFTKVQ